MSNPCSKHGEKYTYTEMQSELLLTIAVFNIFATCIRFISKVVQPPIMKMLYGEEMAYTWTIMIDNTPLFKDRLGGTLSYLV